MEISESVGALIKAKLFKVKYEVKLEILGGEGVQYKPNNYFLVEVWIFSGTTQCISSKICKYLKIIKGLNFKKVRFREQIFPARFIIYV